jgi:hypothetical protein
MTMGILLAQGFIQDVLQGQASSVFTPAPAEARENIDA